MDHDQRWSQVLEILRVLTEFRNYLIGLTPILAPVVLWITNKTIGLSYTVMPLIMVILTSFAYVLINQFVDDYAGPLKNRVVQANWFAVWAAINILTIALVFLFAQPVIVKVSGELTQQSSSSPVCQELVLIDAQGRYHNTRALEDGRFTFTDIPHGTFSIHVNDPEIGGENSLGSAKLTLLGENEINIHGVHRLHWLFSDAFDVGKIVLQKQFPCVPDGNAVAMPN